MRNNDKKSALSTNRSPAAQNAAGEHGLNEATPNTGLVVSSFGNTVAVEIANGQEIPCHLRRNQELPVVGDEVSWQPEGEGAGVVTGIMLRRSLLARGDNRGQMRPLAANVDKILLVMAPPPVFSAYLIDRYLVAAEILGIRPVIVLNKKDLLKPEVQQEVDQLLQSYRQIPYDVSLTCAISGDGLTALAALIKNSTSVLVGPSGVGKSSIISALVKQDIRTRDVSPKGTGKHTTTATRLYHLPQGGALIDSPGVREFNLWPVTAEQIISGFKEFKPYLSGCRFRDCRHLVEPGCKLLEAVESGNVSRSRFENYLELVKK